MLFLLGVGFALGGVATLAYVWYEAGYPGLAVSVTILAIFGGVGGLFFWLPIARAHPWNAPRTLHVDEAGFGLVYGGGKAIRHSWDEADLALSLRAPAIDAEGAGEPSPVFLNITPGSDVAILSREAADCLVDVARSHALSGLDERYQGVLPWRTDGPLPILDRVYARLPVGQVSPTDAWPYPTPALEAGSSQPRSFDLVTGRLRPDALGIDGPAKVGTLTVMPTGLRVDRVNRPPQTYEFRDPKFKLRAGRRLESALTGIDAPQAAWHTSLGGSGSTVFISGAARTAIVDAALTCGLDVRTSRFSFPSRPNYRWLANTTIRSAPLRRR